MGRRCFDGDNINASGLWTVHEEDFNLSAITARHPTAGVYARALRVEADRPIPQPTCLAL